MNKNTVKITMDGNGAIVVTTDTGNNLLIVMTLAVCAKACLDAGVDIEELTELTKRAFYKAMEKSKKTDCFLPSSSRSTWSAFLLSESHPSGCAILPLTLRHRKGSHDQEDDRRRHALSW